MLRSCIGSIQDAATSSAKLDKVTKLTNIAAVAFADHGDSVGWSFWFVGDSIRICDVSRPTRLTQSILQYSVEDIVLCIVLALSLASEKDARFATCPCTCLTGRSARDAICRSAVQINLLAQLTPSALWTTSRRYVCMYLAE